MAELKTVYKKMFARDLKGIIDLPDYADNQRVEIKVSPFVVKKKNTLSDEEINALLDGLAGCLKGLVDPNKTVDDWRKERLEERYGIKFAD